MKQYLSNRRSFLQRSLALLAGLTTLPLLGKSHTTPKVNPPALGTDAFIGEIILFAGDFAPKYWAMCQGQLLPINQNQALFSLLGTTYGGNGTTTFALPDLRGRMAVSSGNTISLGQQSGSPTTTLVASNLPALSFTTDKVDIRTTGTQGSGLTLGGANGGSSGVIAKTNGAQSINNMPPYLALNYIICLQGIFPSRN